VNIEAHKIMEELLGMEPEEVQAVAKEFGIDVKEEKEETEVPKEEGVEVEPEEVVLEPVIKKEAEAKPEAKAEVQEKPTAPPTEGPDPVLEILQKMSPQERAAWALKEGPEAVLKLMELQKIEAAKEIQNAVMEQKKMVLEDVLGDWASKNKDILEDPLLGSIAEGLDMKLLKEAGYSSYLELSPRELKEHLGQVEKILRTMQKKGVSGEILKSSEGGEEKKEEKMETEKKVRGEVKHLGDLGAGGESVMLSAETLESLMDDPLKFEAAVANMSTEQLAEVLKSA